MYIDYKSIQKQFSTFLESVNKETSDSSNTKIISFVSQISPIDIALLTNSNIIRNKDFFYWKIESEKIEFLGFDPILKFNKYGKNRYSDTCSLINNIENNFCSNWNEFNLTKIPLIMGGIKFAPDQKSELWQDYSDSDWFIPNLLVYKANDNYYLVYNFNISDINITNQFKKFCDTLITFNKVLSEKNVLEEQNTLTSQFYSNSVDIWETNVNNALNTISQGEISKVVLSREVNLELNHDVYLPRLLNKLSTKYPKCYTFAFKKEDSIFLGASPEKLAKFNEDWIEVDALAGSAPRGESDIEDLKYESFLLNSKKNLFEQRAVVSFINSLLKNISEEIHFDPIPIIRKLPNIQHLWTIIRAKLKNDYNLFDVLGHLHPTPAICGTPWEKAMEFILEVEPHDRGLYSGNVGWFNFSGSGEFAVAIRAALIKARVLYAYAGCGIVEGSEAQSEFEESEIKLTPILSLFLDEKIYQS